MATRDLGKGKAQLIYDWYDSDHKRRKDTRVVTYTGVKELRRLEREFIIEREAAHKKGTPADCTVRELLDDYIAQCKAKGRRRTTIYGYEMSAKRFFPAFDGVLARELTSYQLDKFVVSLVEINGLAPKTVRETISLLSAAYNYAIRTDLLQSNPCERVTLPRKIKPKHVILSQDDIPRFLECLEEEPHDVQVLFKLALFCGFRRAEILGIRECDINTHFRTIRINECRHDLGDGSYTDDPKTELSRRTVVVPDSIMKDVKSLIEEHHAFPFTPSEYLIQSCGEPMKPTYAEWRMDRFRDKYDFPGLTLHGLRHTFASMLNASGEFDIAVISAALGHSNISTTLNIYTHIFEGASHSSRRIADSLEKWCTNGANDEVCTTEALQLLG